MPNPALLGKPMPLHPTYAADAMARAFWRESYRVSRNYIRSLDALGQTLLVRHERESPEGFSRRQRITKPRNFVGPIIRRYNDFVWRLAPSRTIDNPVAEEFMEDVDGNGTALDAFLKLSLIIAQVEREVFLIPDRAGDFEGSAGRIISKAEATTRGAAPIVRRAEPDAIPWWIDDSSAMTECILMLKDGEARYFNESISQDMKLQRGTGGDASAWLVKEIGPEIPHGYSRLPIVRWRPSFDPLVGGPGESQASPLAEMQQGITQLLSLYNEEISNVTFTQWIATGISAEELKDVPVGNNRILCLPNPQGKMEALGADPAQAKTIADRRADEVSNLYRLAGINFDAHGKGAPESGIAKAFKFNDLAANLAALADSTECAENQLWELLADGWGWKDAPQSKYADDFNLPDFSVELKDLADSLVATEIPATIRRKLVERFTDRNLSLTSDEEDELESEMEKWTKPDANLGGAMPGAPRKLLPAEILPPRIEGERSNSPSVDPVATAVPPSSPPSPR